MCIVQRQQEICQGLGIADFMLEPVQRIPRYKLLLECKLRECCFKLGTRVLHGFGVEVAYYNEAM